MTFQLDTSGVVGGDMWAAKPVLGTIWSDLSHFAQGYIEALFSSVEDRNEEGEPCLQTPPQGGRPPYEAFMATVGFSDLAPEPLARIIADCEAFKAATKTYAITHKLAGREFWEDRQAGLIDAFPPLTVQLGDDGKVRFAA